MDVLGVCVPFHRFLVGSLTNCIQYKSSSCSVDVQVQGVCINFHLCKVSFKCQNAGISGIMSVWYQNEQNADAGASPLPE
jgi:hypothetical protein